MEDLEIVVPSEVKSHTSTSPLLASSSPNNNDEESLPSSSGCCDGDNIFPQMPRAYRFRPYDEELIEYYLKPKVANEKLPPNKIKDVNLYKHNPDHLAGTYEPLAENEWYFFTPRDKKYPNGDRPNRAAGDGYWKATGADRKVELNGEVIGYRKALIFYIGKAPKGQKTEWVMHEFILHALEKKKRDVNDTRLDEWVLCKIYKKGTRNMRAPTRQRQIRVQNGSEGRKSNDDEAPPGSPIISDHDESSMDQIAADDDHEHNNTIFCDNIRGFEYNNECTSSSSSVPLPDQSYNELLPQLNHIPTSSNFDNLHFASQLLGHDNFGVVNMPILLPATSLFNAGDQFSQYNPCSQWNENNTRDNSFYRGI